MVVLASPTSQFPDSHFGSSDFDWFVILRSPQPAMLIIVTGKRTKCPIAKICGPPHSYDVSRITELHQERHAPRKKHRDSRNGDECATEVSAAVTLSCARGDELLNRSVYSMILFHLCAQHLAPRLWLQHGSFFFFWEPLIV